MIFTFGGQSKMMWYRKGSKEFGVHLRHSSVVIMDRTGAGADGSGVEHSVEGAEHSWILVVDVKLPANYC